MKTTTYTLPNLGWTHTMKGEDAEFFKVEPFVRISNAILGDDSYTGATVVWGENWDDNFKLFAAYLTDFGDIEDEMGNKIETIRVFADSLEELDDNICGAFYDLYETYGVKNNYKYLG